MLADRGYAQSGSDATREIQQGAVRIDGKPFKEPLWHADSATDCVVEVGRRVFRLRVVP